MPHFDAVATPLLPFDTPMPLLPCRHFSRLRRHFFFAACHAPCYAYAAAAACYDDVLLPRARLLVALFYALMIRCQMLMFFQRFAADAD